MDINTLHRNTKDKIVNCNDIARIAIRATKPLFAGPMPAVQLSFPYCEASNGSVGHAHSELFSPQEAPQKLCSALTLVTPAHKPPSVYIRPPSARMGCDDEWVRRPWGSIQSTSGHRNSRVWRNTGERKLSQK